jgi:hypothetical protein
VGKAFNGVDRLQLFGFELIALISAGEKETIDDVEKQIADNNIVYYIREKYRDKMFNTFEDNCPYNLDDWNKAFADFSGWVEGNESRKFGIVNNDEGLLLLLALALELVSSKK